jgi:hypothetical protein
MLLATWLLTHMVARTCVLSTGMLRRMLVVKSLATLLVSLANVAS